MIHKRETKDAYIDDAVRLASNSFFYNNYGPIETPEDFSAAFKTFGAKKSIFPENGCLQVLVIPVSKEPFKEPFKEPNTDLCGAEKVISLEFVNEGIKDNIQKFLNNIPGVNFTFKTVSYTCNDGTVFSSDKCTIHPYEFETIRLCRFCGYVVDPEYQASQFIKWGNSYQEFNALKESNKLLIFCEKCSKNIDLKKLNFQFNYTEISFQTMVDYLVYIPKNLLKAVNLVEGSRSFNGERIINSVQVFRDLKTRALKASDESLAFGVDESCATPSEARAEIDRIIKEFRAKLENERVSSAKYISDIVRLIPDALGNSDEEISQLRSMIHAELGTIKTLAAKHNIVLVFVEAPSSSSTFRKLKKIEEAANSMITKTINSSITSYNLKVIIEDEEAAKIKEKCNKIDNFVNLEHTQLLIAITQGQAATFESFINKIDSLLN